MVKKKTLRSEFLKKRDSLTSEEIFKKSRLVKKRLLGLKEFKQAQTILFYVSFRSEVQTEKAIKEALKLEKTVVVPLVHQEKGELTLHQIKDFEKELKPGFMGIPEPDEKTPLVDLSLVDLVVIPGCAFDLRGFRLGYGRGFFDKLLKKISPKTRTIGLAFELQIVKELPEEPHDIPLHKIITEERIIGCQCF